MKKIGQPMVLRGQMAPNVNGHRIHIFDGKYTTGYRILEFHVMPKSPTTESEIFAKIHTSRTSYSVGAVDMGDSQQLAWCTWGAPYRSRQSTWSLIDPDNMIIEDLYMSNYFPEGETGADVNYFIVIQKYEFPSWDGAGILVSNLSQAGPQ